VIPLSPLLIFGWGPFPRLGVAGGAVAVLLYYGGAIPFLAHAIWSGRNVVKPHLRATKIRGALLYEILRVGLVAAAITVTTNVTVALTTGIVGRAGSEAPLSTLHRLVERVGSKETEGRKARRREWLAVRGALHLALARRGSKVALYDLREAVEQATEPLPGDFLDALVLVGDATALEPLAAAYVHADVMADGEAWRRGLADAFRAVAAREKVTGRHSVMKRVRTRFRDHVAELLGSVGSDAVKQR